MQVKIFGFTWESNPRDAIIPFLKSVQAANSVEIESLNHMLDVGFTIDQGDYHRILGAGPLEDNLWGGFILTVKNAKSFVQSTRTPTGGFRISISQIENETDKFSEINFFIFNPNNGAGLYEYYHNSARISTLNGTFIEKFRLFASTNGLQHKKLRTSIHLTPSDFKQRISELGAIHNIEYELTTLDIADKPGAPAPNKVQRKRCKVFYNVRVQQGLAAEIGSYIDEYGDKIKKLFLKGKTPNGREVHYSLMSDPSVFHNYEFNDFTVDLDIEAGTPVVFGRCKNIIDLLNLARTDSVKDFFYKVV